MKWQWQVFQFFSSVLSLSPFRFKFARARPKVNEYFFFSQQRHDLSLGGLSSCFLYLVRRISCKTRTSSVFPLDRQEWIQVRWTFAPKEFACIRKLHWRKLLFNKHQNPLASAPETTKVPNHFRVSSQRAADNFFFWLVAVAVSWMFAHRRPTTAEWVSGKKRKNRTELQNR